MKGKIAQRRYYDRVLPVLKSVMARVRAADRPALRRGDALPAGRRRLRHRGLGLHDRNRRGGRRLHARTSGPQGRTAARHLLPSVPLGGHRARAAAREGHGRDGAAGYPDDAVEPAALRNQGGVRRCHGGHAGISGGPPHAEVHRRLGRSGQPRRARRRFHRHGGEHAQSRSRGSISRWASSTRRRCRSPSIPTCARPVRSPCAAIRWAAMAR